MNGYELVLFLHVLAAIIWVGGACAVQVFAFLTLRRDVPEEVSRFAGDAEVIGMKVFMPASLVVVLAGGWMVYDGPWEMAEGWVGLGLGLYLLSFITGAGFLGPEAGRIHKLSEEHGAAAPEVQRRIRRVMFVSRIELIWLLAIVALMVFKP